MIALRVVFLICTLFLRATAVREYKFVTNEDADLKEESFSVTEVTKEELHKQVGTGNSWAVSEAEFNNAIFRQASSFVEAHSELRDRSPSKQTDNGESVDVESSMEYQKLLEQTASYVEKHRELEAETEKKYKEKIRDTFVSNAKPAAAGGFCIFMDYTVYGVLSGNVGIQGTVSKNFQNGCWGSRWTVDLSFSVGFEWLGKFFKISAGVSGVMSAYELPPGLMVAKDKEHLLYLPDGVDLSRCHSSSPWPMLMTFVDRHFKRVKKSPDYQARLERLKQEHVERKKQFDKEYGWLLGGPPHSDVDFTAEFCAPRFVYSALALEERRSVFLRSVASLASVVTERFLALDDSHNSLVSENNRFGKYAKALRQSRGRYLARWQSSTGRGGGTMKMMNFAKAAHKSKHSNDPSFWREFGVSAANAAVRFLGDVVALFGLVYGGDPHWNGKCESLDLNVDLRNGYRAAEWYAWSSAQEAKNRRTRFLYGFFDDAGHNEISPHAWCRLLDAYLSKDDNREAVEATVEGSLDGDVFVGKVEQACVSVEYDYSEFDFKTHSIEWSEKQQHWVVLLNGERVGRLWGMGADWMGLVPKKLVVLGDVSPDKQAAGSWRVRLSEATVEGSLDGDVFGGKVEQGGDYANILAESVFVAREVVSTRGECEVVKMPLGLVALLPSFVAEVKKTLVDLELALFELNLCAGMTHNSEALTSRIGAKKVAEIIKGGGSCSGENLNGRYRHMRRTAVGMAGYVREMMAGFGASRPKLKLQLKGYDEFLPSEAELALFAATDSLEERVAQPFLKPLGEDLDKGLGYGVIHQETGSVVACERAKLETTFQKQKLVTVEMMKETGDFVYLKDGVLEEFNATKLRRDKGEVVMLTGMFWRLIPTAEAMLREGMELLPQKSRELFSRPPVAYTATLTGYMQTGPLNPCIPTNGMFIIKSYLTWSWNSWSTEVTGEECLGGRMRPGHLWIDIFKCVGEGYSDWRMTWGTLLFALSTKVASFSLGNAKYVTPGQIISGAAAHFSGFSKAGALIRHMQKIEDHKFVASLKMLSTATSPFIFGITTQVVFHGASEKWNFANILQKFLLDHTYLGAVTTPEQIISQGQLFNPADKGTVLAAAMLQVEMRYRVKEVRVDVNTARVSKQLKNMVVNGIVSKVSTSFGMNIMFVTGLMSPKLSFWGAPLGRLRMVGTLGAIIYWDFTKWLESVVNYMRYKGAKRRGEKCEACLRVEKAWCDKKIALGTLWRDTDDACVEDTEEERETCENMVGFMGVDGVALRGAFYSAGHGHQEGLLACARIPFRLANSDVTYDEKTKKFALPHM